MSNQKNIAEQVAAMLLEVEAVQVRPDQPFRWSSGWYSPIYCDGRLTLSFPKVRKFIKSEFIELIKKEYPNAEAVAGVATAGIPQGAMIADGLELPFLYVRSKAKGHGKENLVEGKLTKGQKVVVIEDVLSTGGSSIKAVEALREAGVEVLGIVSMFTYGFDVMEQNMANAKLKFNTLSNYTTLIVEFSRRHDLNEKMMASLHEWRRDPAKWQPREMDA